MSSSGWARLAASRDHGAGTISDVHVAAPVRSAVSTPMFAACDAP
jgi:hypothetical protein